WGCPRTRPGQQVDAVAEKELGERFGVTGFPTLKYFPAGSGEVEAYSGGRDLKSLMDFLNKKARLFWAGKSRTLEGGLSGGAGRLDALDAVLSSTAAAAASTPTTTTTTTPDLVTLLEGAIAKAGYPAGSDDAASAGHYARAAKKLAEKGKGYLRAEIERLEALLQGTGVQAVTPVKKTLFMVRGNILRSFVEFGFGDDVEGGEEEKGGEGGGAASAEL
ncbi:unnamed protein product, partial [Laminaria digitata]